MCRYRWSIHHLYNERAGVRQDKHEKRENVKDKLQWISMRMMKIFQLLAPFVAGSSVILRLKF